MKFQVFQKVERKAISTRFIALVCFLLLSLMSIAASLPAAERANGPIKIRDMEASKIYEQALPGYKYRFPEDHYSHDRYRTEWWYYTGHLKSENGKEFGFELTFFRSASSVEGGVKTGAWSLNNIYMAHFAITDIDGRKFFNDEKLSRAGVGSAGASQTACKVWTENWSLDRSGKTHNIRAVDGEYSLQLALDEASEPVIHGENGVSQKASCVGCASHYYSFTRMPARGTLKFNGASFKVDGEAWMDHEFGSNQLTAEQVGWDWFSLQLDDKTELMLYAMRLKNSKLDQNSSGTSVSQKKVQHLRLSDYTITATKQWKSPHTGGVYPAGWHVIVPSLKLELDLEPELADQELVSHRNDGISYWEGACSVKGKKDGKAITGKAYVELTGYNKNFHMNI